MQLPPDLCSLSRLQHLDFQDNDFEDFPAVLLGLPQLVYLNIGGCRSQRSKIQPIIIPDGINRLTALKTLLCPKNQIESLPAMTNMKRLETLATSNNRITQVRSIRTLHLTVVAFFATYAFLYILVVMLAFP